MANKKICWAARDLDGSLYIYSFKPEWCPKNEQWAPKDFRTEIMTIRKGFEKDLELTSVTVDKPTKVEILINILEE